MIAFLLAELRRRGEGRAGRSAYLAAIAMALASLVGPLDPLVVCVTGAAASVVLGWTDGNRRGGTRGSGPAAHSFPASPAAIAAGMALSSVALWLAAACFLSPFLAASAIAWGLPVESIAACVLCWLSAYLLAGAAGSFSSLAFPGTEGLTGLFLYSAWLVASLLAEPIRASNPLAQAWALMKLEEGRAPLWGMGIDLAVAAALYAAAPLAIARARRRSHG
jgi:hypothetical protein